MATDEDSGRNAQVTYHIVEGAYNQFDIDPKTGKYVKLFNITWSFLDLCRSLEVALHSDHVTLTSKFSVQELYE